MAASNRTLRRDPLMGAIPDRLLQHAGDCATCGTFTPEDGSPTAIVIGSRAPIDSLRRLAVRHRLETEALIAFAQGA
jgi:hypothetical protein